jgi:hypothetical protein
MLQKFKMTTYATLLLITVFVLPYAGNVTAEGDDVTKAVDTLAELCKKKGQRYTLESSPMGREELRMSLSITCTQDIETADQFHERKQKECIIAKCPDVAKRTIKRIMKDKLCEICRPLNACSTNKYGMKC